MSSSLDKLIHRLLENCNKEDWLETMNKSDKTLLISCLNDKRYHKMLRKKMSKTVLAKLKSKLSPQQISYKKKRSAKVKNKAAGKQTKQTTKPQERQKTTTIEDEEPKRRKNKRKSLPASLIDAMNKLHISNNE